MKTNERKRARESVKRDECERGVDVVWKLNKYSRARAAQQEAERRNGSQESWRKIPLPALVLCLAS